MNTDAPPCSFVNRSNKMRERVAGHAREPVPPEPIFMIKSRNLMNLSGGIGLVKKSAGLTSVLTRGTTSSCASTMSRTRRSGAA